MKVVGVENGPVETGGEELADCGLATAGDAHDQDAVCAASAGATGDLAGGTAVSHAASVTGEAAGAGHPAPTTSLPAGSCWFRAYRGGRSGPPP